MTKGNYSDYGFLAEENFKVDKKVNSNPSFTVKIELAHVIPELPQYI